MPRDVGLWAKNKLRLLELYLPGYLQASTTAIDRIYIDAFAGPGRNRARETGEEFDGSPLIALDAEAANGMRFTELYFIEQDPELADELESILAIRDPDHRAHVIRGDTNVEMPMIVRGKNRRAPIFVFLDTDAIEPSWETLESIAAWRTELLINFPLGFAINRNLSSYKITRFFGTDEWMLIPSNTRGLLDLYKRRLREIGYVEQIEGERLISTETGGRGRRLYYLIPVSQHPAARRIWRWVFDQPEAAGQTRMNLS